MSESSRRAARMARVLKAMAHPLRIWALEELAASGERCVCELARMSGTDDSTMSRHLSHLRLAGLVADERRGVQVFYRLIAPDVIDLLRGAETVSGIRARDGSAAVGHTS
jgi:DNA-binding transcriptional ArsR family regulator